MRAHVGVVLASVALLAPLPLAAGQAASPWETSEGAFMRVQLVTVGRGASLTAAWGHTGLLVADDASGLTIFYNYGAFNTSDVAALAGVAVGTAKYSVEAMEALGALKAFREEGRDVFLRELRLPPEARLALARQAAEDALPENKHYRYDPYFDNCATRVRDLLDGLTGGALANATQGRPSPLTLREDGRRYLADRPATDTIVDLGTGREADAPATMWDALYLPLALDQAILDLTVTDASTGRELPFVVRTTVYHDVEETPLVERPPSRTPFALAAGGGAAAFLLALALAARARVPHASRALSASAITLACLLGALAVLLVVRRVVGATAPTNQHVWVYTPLFLVAALAPERLRPGAWALAGLVGLAGALLVRAAPPHAILAALPAAGAAVALTMAGASTRSASS